jgi:hypothetical protein
MASEIPAPPKPRFRTVWPAILGLVGLDYFSTLAYQPSIAYEVAGRLAPLATAAVVVLTCFGLLPIYCYVAGRSPPGHGALGLLERLVHGWRGKILVLVLLGFVATNFVFTRTLSTADAAVHLVHNPNPAWQEKLGDWGLAGQQLKPLSDNIAVRWVSDIWNRQLVATLLLLSLNFVLWPIAGRGFTRRLIHLAGALVALYLLLTAVVIGSGLIYVARHPELAESWWHDVRCGAWGIDKPRWAGTDAWSLVGMSIWLLPKLALGLSGFEMSLAVVPLLRDDKRGQVARTRRVLIGAALIMSAFLLGSAFVTTVLIDPASLQSGAVGRERALAAMAHGQALPTDLPAQDLNPLFGLGFGTAYDVVTILVLCLAGASVTMAMKELLPQFLLRFGMEMRWAYAIGAIYHIFNVINLAVTVMFRASVESQRGAYAVSVLVLMTAAAYATTLDLKASRRWLNGLAALPVAALTAVLAAMTLGIVIRQPGCLWIAGLFIAAIIASSVISRYYRASEFRFEGFDFADDDSRQLWEHVRRLEYSVLIPIRPGGQTDVNAKAEVIRKRHRVAEDVVLIYLEVEMGDPSDFTQRPLMVVCEEGGRFHLRITRCVSIAHVIVAIGHEFSKVGEPPEIHFGWSDQHPIAAMLQFLLFGEGNIPFLVNDLLRRHEPDHTKRPRVVIG